MAAGSLDLLHTGEYVVIGGLFVQIIFFGFFMAVAVTFHLRLNKHPTSLSMDPAVPWLKHLAALYAASALIMVRSIFRVIEYVQGNRGYLLRHEVFLYIFDAVLMLAVMVIFNVIHPSEITSKTHKYTSDLPMLSNDFASVEGRAEMVEGSGHTKAAH